ncbi:hypothetical protein PBI_PEREGRIN_23 [Rhodococcus phage Peregrin]|jgi:hypothetical protein|nr:hypothetical protein PBI_PEREGRIN_23 [Rhodococcus phage Peregrin]
MNPELELEQDFLDGFISYWEYTEGLKEMGIE